MATTNQGFYPISRESGAIYPYTDLAFLTFHPPDVPVRSRIVAVCGISDDKNLAGPKDDGWFISDFFLFYHLLQPPYGHRSNQIWMLCESPRRLVEKYKEYAHGNPRNERRVVLDQTMLPAIDSAQNLRIVPKGDLGERFVKTVEEQARLAFVYSETLILLVFGHGDKDSHGVYLGGRSPQNEKFILKIDRLKRCFPPQLQVTLLMTSCYSGGWLVQPSVNHKMHLNVTGLAASGPGKETRSWSMSKSVGRACGSTVATAIVQQLIEVEEVKEYDEDYDDRKQPRRHDTYFDFVRSIYQHATKLDPFMSDQEMHFSAQDDDWELHWQQRTGIPLVTFRERWRSLRSVQPSGTQAHSTAEGHISSRKVGALQLETQRAIDEYRRSEPPSARWASNVAVHGRIWGFEHGTISEEMIQYLLGILTCRLNMTYEVDEFVEAIGLKFQSCFGFQVDGYRFDTAKRMIYDRATHLLFRSGLFTTPCEHPDFLKPLRFLAIVIAETCQFEEIDEKVNMLQKFARAKELHVLPYVRGHSILEDDEVKKKKNAFLSAMQALGHKVHVKAFAIAPKNLRSTNYAAPI
ncbi:hypothetical protein BDV26DRAFT_261773 [Aspergillus bertholletiae]|uniref:Uncharacterized protein n=1 Tax=Aspergillus bertholletiae TaxID=1226010 RepID=A0A5N7B9C4_9EURO|nr:hypothetical protein BDV26DRAFT_261773 [Aspergillus bertholletiae]